MALQKKENIFNALLLTLVVTLPLATSENIDCKGKAFYCVNSTHFKICVDLGGGVSKTVDDFLIPCPLNTACKDDNYFECEYQLTTTLVPFGQSDVTNEVVEASINTLENFEATTLYPEKNLNNLEELKTNRNFDTELRSTVNSIDIVNGSFTSLDITTEPVNLSGDSDFINTSSSDINSESVAVSSTQDLSFDSSTKIDDLSTSEKVILINNVENDLFLENISRSQNNLPQIENYVTESYNIPVLYDSSVINNTNYKIENLNGANISLQFETFTLSTTNEIYNNLSNLENTADVIISNNLNIENTEVPLTTISSLLEPVITTDTNNINTELITSLNTEPSNFATNDFKSQSSNVVIVKSNFHEIDISTFTNTEKYVDHKASQVIFNSTDIFKLITTPDGNSLDSEQISSLNVVDSSTAQTDKTLQSSRNNTLSDKITTELHEDDVPNLVSTEKLSPYYTRVTEQAYTVDESSMDTEQTPTLKSLDSLNLESINLKSHLSSVHTHIDMSTDIYKKEGISTDVFTEKYLKKAQPELTTVSNYYLFKSTTDPNRIHTNEITILNNLATTLAPIHFEKRQSIENRLIDYGTTNIYKIDDITIAKSNSFDTDSTPFLNNLDSSTLPSINLKENMHFGESSTNLYNVEDLMLLEPSTKLFDTDNTTITNITKKSDPIINLLEPLPSTTLTTEILENVNPEIYNRIERVDFQKEVKNYSEHGSSQAFLQSTENILAQAMFEPTSRGIDSTSVRDKLKLSEINISLNSKDDPSKNATIELNAIPNSLLKNGSLNIENVKQEVLVELLTNNPLTSNPFLKNESETSQILVRNIDSKYSTSTNILSIISEIPTETNFLQITNNNDSENKLVNNITKIDYVHKNTNGTSIFESAMQEEMPLLSTVTESYVTTFNVDISYNSSSTLKPTTIIENIENSTKRRTDVHLLEKQYVNTTLHTMNIIPAHDAADFVVNSTGLNNKEEETIITNIKNIELVNGAQSDRTASLANTNRALISFLNVSENVHFSSDQIFHNNLSTTNNVTTTANNASGNFLFGSNGNNLHQMNVNNYNNEPLTYKESLNNFTERAVTNYVSESPPKNDLISNENVVESINIKNEQPTIKSIVYSLNTNAPSNKENRPVNTDIFLIQNDTQVIKSEHIHTQPQFTVILQNTSIDKETNVFSRILNNTQANHRDVDSSNNSVIYFNDTTFTNNKNNATVSGFNNGDNNREFLSDGIARSSPITNDKIAENIQVTTISHTNSSKVNIIQPTTNFEYLTKSPMINVEENDFNISNIKQNVKENLKRISTINSSVKNSLVSQNSSSTSDPIQKLADDIELVYFNKTDKNIKINNNKTINQLFNNTRLLNYMAILQNTSTSKNVFLRGNDSKTYLDGNNKQIIQTFTVKSLSNETMQNTYSIEMKPKLQFTCVSRPRGKYSDENNCNKFYICIGKGEPIIGICPVETVFSEINKQCTKNLSHCIRNNQFKCLSSGRFIDILSEEFYYICVRKQDGYVRYKLQCQKGYYLNKENIKCTVNSASRDESSKNSSDKSTNERKSSELTHSSNNEKNFECVKEGKYEFPDDCRKYYMCIKNKNSEFRRKIKKCDSDEVFDKKKRKCVDADSYEC